MQESRIRINRIGVGCWLGGCKGKKFIERIVESLEELFNRSTVQSLNRFEELFESFNRLTVESMEELFNRSIVLKNCRVVQMFGKC